MQFLRENADTGTARLIDTLGQMLEQRESVLWLVCGGSSIAIAVKVMAALPEEQSSKLTIMLTDERYGPVGHNDSNAVQLLAAGFDVKKARFIPTLGVGLSLADTARSFGGNFAAEADLNDVIIAQFGIGADGHIAGILPESPAATAVTPAAGYHTEQFDRITLTFGSLARIHTAFAFVYGADKQPALQRLNDDELSPTTQPSQILKRIPESYVYNDAIAS